jgi:hypothetical protein
MKNNASTFHILDAPECTTKPIDLTRCKKDKFGVTCREQPLRIGNSRARKLALTFHLLLIDGREDVQSEDPGKNGPSNPGLVVQEDLGAVATPPGTLLPEVLPPTIPAPTAPSGMPPMPDTSAVDTATGCRH